MLFLLIRFFTKEIGLYFHSPMYKGCFARMSVPRTVSEDIACYILTALLAIFLLIFL